MSLTKPPPTMADIARAAGVSPMTVSRALRNDPRHSKATRARIRKLAGQMGYRSNPLISALNARKQASRNDRYIATIAICVINPGDIVAHSTVRRMSEGIRRRAAEFGYTTEVCSIPSVEDAPAWRRMEKILSSRGMVGIIFLPMGDPHTRFPVELKSFACVSIGYTLENPVLHRVVHHHFHGMHLALEALKAKGYRRIGFVDNMGVEERVWQLWLSAYLTHSGLETTLPPFNFTSNDETKPEVVSNFERWYLQHEPDAIVTPVPEPRIVEMVAKMELQMQREIAVAYLDLPPRASDAGIDQLSELVGSGAFDLLMGQLLRNERGIPEHPKTMLIMGQWSDGIGNASSFPVSS